MNMRAGSFLHVQPNRESALWIMPISMGVDKAEQVATAVRDRLPYMGVPLHGVLHDGGQQTVSFSPADKLTDSQIVELAEATGATLMRVEAEVRIQHWAATEERRRHTTIRLIATRPWILGIDTATVVAVDGVASCDRLFHESGEQKGVSFRLAEATSDPEVLADVIRRVCDVLKADCEVWVDLTRRFSLAVPDVEPAEVITASSTPGGRYSS